MDTIDDSADQELVVSATINMLSLRKQMEEASKIICATYDAGLQIEWIFITMDIDKKNEKVLAEGTWQETNDFSLENIQRISKFMSEKGLVVQ